MAFKNLQEIIDTEENGFVRYYGFRKKPNGSTGSESW
jgi:hypothetical protein